MLSEIADLTPDRRFIIRSKTGPGWLGTWEFEPEGAGTLLHWMGQLTLKGFARLLEPLIGRQMRSQIDRQFAVLPHLVEAEIPE